MKSPAKNRSSVIFILVGILLLCLFLAENVRISESFQIDATSMTVVVYENSKTATRTRNLEKLLSKFGYNYEVIGKGDPWTGWYGRLRKCREYLNKKNDEEYILFSDGRDVIVDENATSFTEKAIKLYNEKGGKIIFNGETLCCVAGKEFKGTSEEKEEYFEKVQKFFEKIQPHPAPPLYTLNYGLAFGKTRDFKEMFRIMDLKPDEDDQGVLIQKILEGKFSNYAIDYENTLFGIMFTRPPEWDTFAKKYANPETKTFPGFLHFPGKSPDYEDCAKKVVKEYIKESAII